MFGSWKRTGMLSVLLILALFTTGCFGLFTTSTYRLNVTVLDGNNDQPIEGASVVVGNAAKDTDEDGHATFPSLSGTVTIEVTAGGFDAVTRTVTMNQARNVTIRMGVGDIVDTAIDAPGFETLVAAVLAADLEDALRGAGPFTVFAPTDEAFEDVPEALFEYLLANPDKLAEVLLYHVVPDRIWAADAIAVAPASLNTLQGDAIDVTTVVGEVFINDDAKVVFPDVGASNGVIHVIDMVLIPPSLEVDDIVDTAVAGGFDTLVTAVLAADLEDALRGAGPFTVFAPTDDAFADLPEGDLDDLLDDPDELAEILKYHVVAGYYTAADALDEAPVFLETLQGDFVEITVINGGVFVNGVEVSAADIRASNGIIHVIDAVLIPE